MILAAVVVTDLNNAIGKDNKLLCHLPTDLKFFKATTMGSPIIMGRKTFESIGRILPGRKNIIISRNKDLKIEGAEVYPSLEEMAKHCKVDKAFIIGGAEIYNLTMPYTTEIYRTLIKHEFEADTFYPEIKFAEFNLVWEEEHWADEKNPYDYTFQKYVRV
ncbi:MAG: dihydrofolate reductase [Bacteroidia bacterium]|nr:dihydrofolate reductase [Bacteroidia bacterium]